MAYNVFAVLDHLWNRIKEGASVISAGRSYQKLLDALNQVHTRLKVIEHFFFSTLYYLKEKYLI